MVKPFDFIENNFKKYQSFNNYIIEDFTNLKKGLGMIKPPAPAPWDPQRPDAFLKSMFKAGSEYDNPDSLFLPEQLQNLTRGVLGRYFRRVVGVARKVEATFQNPGNKYTKYNIYSEDEQKIIREIGNTIRSYRKEFSSDFDLFRLSSLKRNPETSALKNFLTYNDGVVSQQDAGLGPAAQRAMNRLFLGKDIGYNVDRIGEGFSSIQVKAQNALLNLRDQLIPKIQQDYPEFETLNTRLASIQRDLEYLVKQGGNIVQRMPPGKGAPSLRRFYELWEQYKKELPSIRRMEGPYQRFRVSGIGEDDEVIVHKLKWQGEREETQYSRFGINKDELPEVQDIPNSGKFSSLFSGSKNPRLPSDVEILADANDPSIPKINPRPRPPRASIDLQSPPRPADSLSGNIDNKPGGTFRKKINSDMPNDPAGSDEDVELSDINIELPVDEVPYLEPSDNLSVRQVLIDLDGKSYYVDSSGKKILLLRKKEDPDLFKDKKEQLSEELDDEAAQDSKAGGVGQESSKELSKRSSLVDDPPAPQEPPITNPEEFEGDVDEKQATEMSKGSKASSEDAADSSGELSPRPPGSPESELPSPSIDPGPSPSNPRRSNPRRGTLDTASASRRRCRGCS